MVKHHYHSPLIRLLDCICKTLSTPAHRPFFSRPEFFPSLPKPFLLPSYAKGISRQFPTQRIADPPSRPVVVSSRVIEFIDHEAVESDGESSASNCSNLDVFMSTSSSPTASSYDLP